MSWGGGGGSGRIWGGAAVQYGVRWQALGGDVPRSPTDLGGLLKVAEYLRGEEEEAVKAEVKQLEGAPLLERKMRR